MMIALRTPSSLAAFAAFALAVGAAQGATIYSHSFGGGTESLNGVTPDTTTGGATWTASDNIRANGSISGGSNGSSDSAWLAFTPQSGFIYTLTATMGQTHSGTSTADWMALGFAADNDTTTFFGNDNQASPWVLHRRTDTIRRFTGPGTGGGSDIGTFAGTVTLSIVLDTRDTQWTATWFEGANQLSTHTYAIGQNPTITHVGFGRNNRSQGPVSAFSLTAIPEPSAALLGGLGMLCLLRRRR